ncbi:TIR domain protein [Methyloversatilis sp. RAC08]|uniref:toll/interleukin-1 receptor domain-containing protein n=1 Tax=Methyloversatilis sp. RAC08 TaxID=1842540 RepID=UPI00083D2A78|nr:toll/interleukin-1 receptor domain-containing protein [Methyloversatilis sp. RAC08]AOF81360.1 TIR domain protein [Methyloversatilis sp. RAC08]
MARLFISYRRKDSSGYAQTLHEDLLQAFPGMEVFRDLESIAAGEDFVDAIERELDRCNVVLVLVGPHWLSMTDAQGKRRLDNPNDPVRMEIARALTRRGVRVIPVLVGGAVMPDAAELPEELSALGRRNAHEMTDKRWQYDFGELCGVLEKLPGMPMRSTASDSTTHSSSNKNAAGDDDLPLPESFKKPVGRVIGAARKLVWGVGIFFTFIIVVAIFVGEEETTPQPAPAPAPFAADDPAPAPVAPVAPVAVATLPAPAAPAPEPERDLTGNWTMVDAQGERIPLTLTRQGNDLTLRSPRINVTQHPVWQVYNAVLIQTYGQGVTDIHFEGAGEAYERDVNFALNIFANGNVMINTGSLSLRVANSSTMTGTLRYNSGETSVVTVSRSSGAAAN